MKKAVYMGSAKPDPNAKFPLLISYHYLRQWKHEEIDYFIKHPHTELLLDSGAFTSLNTGTEIHLSEYMDFLKTYKDDLFGYFALDKLGDDKVTKGNLQLMIQNGLKPLPIHVRGMNGDDMNELYKYSDYIGLGGFRRPQRGPAKKNYVKQKMTWAKGRNVHWLGYTNASMINAFKPYSVDCSSWTAPLRYGRLSIYMGGGSWSSNYSYKDFKDLNIDKKVLPIIKRNGYNLEQMSEEKYWRCNMKKIEEFATLFLSIDSWYRYITDVRSHIGTRLFMACAHKENTKTIHENISRWRSDWQYH